MLRRLTTTITALMVLLGGAATAGAQQQVLGSLDNPANATFGCDTMPTVLDMSGNYSPVASGRPDCTWANTGGGTVPGDGTVQKITIRSGPSPAAIRFVVLRTLAQPGYGSFCCFFVAETSISRPEPNSVQSFVVNLPVERNTNPDTQVMTQDNIGVSAVSGSGTLPIFDNGRHNILDPITPALNASWWYPRVSSASDTGSGLRPTGGANGWQVLLQTTFCPKGSEAACGLAGPPDGGGEGGGGGGGGGGAGGNGGPPDTAAPQIAQPVFRPAAFRVGPQATPIAARARGATLSFVLSEAATATITIQRPVSGRKVGGRCVTRTRKNARRARCTRWTAAGRTLTRKNLPAGATRMPFSGRIGRKALAVGRYRAVIRAKDAAGNGSPVATTRFRIVAR